MVKNFVLGAPDTSPLPSGESSNSFLIFAPLVLTALFSKIKKSTRELVAKATVRGIEKGRPQSGLFIPPARRHLRRKLLLRRKLDLARFQKLD
jgi:hypothetical protein